MSIGVSIFILIDSFENLNEVLLLFSILIVVSLLYFPNNLYAADHFVSSSSDLTFGNQSIYTSKNIRSAFRIAKNGLKY